MFIKEISTNGDMNTVDVLFPSSPFFLYFNPDLLKFMIEPVLSYASNETIIEYNSPYSPHQLGVYPFGDSKTEDQEQMPLENTSNMFIMLLSILQRNDDTVWFEERFDMLKTWADDLLSSLPFPETQLSTDDFMGAYPNNTNLAAKGCIGLEAFSVVCEMLDGDDCEVYKEKAESFADTWVEESYTNQPSPHYKMAFGQANHTYSLKYNLVWQKILNLDGPFKNWKDIAKDEVEFYKGKGLKYGVPLEVSGGEVMRFDDSDDFERLTLRSYSLVSQKSTEHAQSSEPSRNSIGYAGSPSCLKTKMIGQRSSQNQLLKWRTKLLADIL